MGWVNRNLKQTITVFSAGTKDLYGNPTWSVSTVKGRWEDKQTKTVDSNGDELISNAEVFLDTDVSVGDYLYLGTTASTSPPATSREVKNFSKTPDIRVTQYIRKAFLK